MEKSRLPETELNLTRRHVSPRAEISSFLHHLVKLPSTLVTVKVTYCTVGWSDLAIFFRFLKTFGIGVQQQFGTT